MSSRVHYDWWLAAFVALLIVARVIERDRYLPRAPRDTGD